MPPQNYSWAEEERIHLVYKHIKMEIQKRPQEYKTTREAPYIRLKLKKSDKSCADKVVKIFEGMTTLEHAQRCGQSVAMSHNILVVMLHDDLEMFIIEGYGHSLNYRIGVPLLQDVILFMEHAIKAKEEGLAPRNYKKRNITVCSCINFGSFFMLFTHVEGSGNDKQENQ